LTACRYRRQGFALAMMPQSSHHPGGTIHINNHEQLQILIAEADGLRLLVDFFLRIIYQQIISVYSINGLHQLHE
jgi:hypothetical protein